MKCDDIANQPDRRCPGNFKLNCANDDVGSGFDPDNDCDVGYSGKFYFQSKITFYNPFQFCPNGGFVMSGDCSEALACYTLLFPKPGRTLKCALGYKVAVDFYALE